VRAMIFRQLFDQVSSTYTYLIANRRGGEALIIDPVLDKVERYLQLLKELDLKLIKAIDTHVHADHITGLGALRDRTRCVTVMGQESGVDVVSMRVAEGDKVEIEGLSLEALFTPGHTDDSYSFLMGDRVFTGDALLIRGTGRTDFQNGDPAAAYDSIFNKLLKLPDETLVYPAHDYKGDTVSTIGEETAFNPRLQVDSVEQYVEIMNNLNLPDPKMMDVAVPANLHVGLSQDEIEARGWSLDCGVARELLERSDHVLVDLRDQSERERHGVIPGSVHAPYTELEDNLAPGGLLHELVRSTGRRLVFYCAFGERSAMAVQAAQDAGLTTACHIRGGLDAWKTADGQVQAERAAP
jgi:glyoxylase-like metal-dependent hydrolase (beta-lactamase superfamily II)/rhodanese-related sulfurtransferase